MSDVRLPPPLSLEGNLSENFKRFKQHWEIYLVASGKDDKEDKVKIATLLNLIGEEGIEIYNTLKLTDEQKKVYKTVIEELETYFTPKKNVVYERFVFYNRKQEEGETFDHFATDLKKLVKSCEFHETDSMVRDRIVFGIRSKALQEKLLQMDKLDLEKATKVCRANEIASAQVKEVQGTSSGVKIDAVKRNNSGPNKAFEMNRGNKHVTEGKIETFDCRSCGFTHTPRQCPAFGKRCTKCQKYGHFRKMCRNRNRSVKEVQEKCSESDYNSDSYSEDELLVASITVDEVKSCTEWTESLKIGKALVTFKIDTGSQVNIISKNVFDKIKTANKNVKLNKCNVTLEAYGGFKISPLGSINIDCLFKNNKFNIRFVVVEGNLTPILGLSSCINLNLVSKVDSMSALNKDSFIKQNQDVFMGLGKFNKKCTLKLKKNAQPVARPPRRVALAIKGKLKAHLDSLEKRGIISKFDEPTEWLSNVVIIEKNDKSLRLCLDPKDLNEALEREFCVIPTLDEIRSKLQGQNYFTVLDFKEGFYQVELNEESSKLCAFGTIFGVYKFNRLPFGLNCAPEFFQKLNNKNFGDIQGCLVYFDDLLIYGDCPESHDRALNNVIQRARQLNVKFNSAKIQYRVNEVKYLGNKFNNEGMQPDEEKIQAILGLKEPKNKKELQKILGMINYLRSYIPKLSTLSAPLRELLKDNIVWVWTKKQADALNNIKSVISSPPVLANFDEAKPIVIQTDSSQSGLGCCLLQKSRPVAYASRALTDAESRFSQIEKEFTAILWSCTKFHNFIYGREVTIHSDHKPLEALMRKGVAEVHSPRLQRIKVKLLKYNLNVCYKPGKEMYIADLLSRNYLLESTVDDKFITEVIHSINVTKEKKAEFQQESERDSCIQKIIFYCTQGWPSDISKVALEAQPYFQIRNDIYVFDGLAFYNNRIIVPKSLRAQMLNFLHETHFGITKTQQRAKQIIYWPRINSDIENTVKDCKICEKHRRSNVKEPMILRKFPDFPFEKVASDILEYGGHSYLVIIDYFSKWLEVIRLERKTSQAIIAAMKTVFSNHGIPTEVYADNMPYSSKECSDFARSWCFKFVTSSPHYPKSNGLAERAVGIAKNMLRKCQDLELALLEYRNTPVTGLDKSPAQLLTGRLLRAKLPSAKQLSTPTFISWEEEKQKLEKNRDVYKNYYDRTAMIRKEFEEKDNVVIQEGKTWQPAIVTKKLDTPRSYIIQKQNGNFLRRNSSHIRPSRGHYQLRKDLSDFDHDHTTEDNSQDKDIVDQTETLTSPTNNNFVPRKSNRVIKQPKRFNDFNLNF